MESIVMPAQRLKRRMKALGELAAFPMKIKNRDAFEALIAVPIAVQPHVGIGPQDVGEDGARPIVRVTVGMVTPGIAARASEIHAGALCFQQGRYFFGDVESKIALVGAMARPG